MSRLRCLSGLETGDLNEWNSSTVSAANWTIAAAAGSQRGAGGTYGLEVIRSSAAGTSGGAYVTQEWGGDNSKYNQFRAGDPAPAMSALEFPIAFRFYYRVNTWGGGSNIIDLIRFTSTLGQTGGAADATFAVSLSGANRTIFANANNGLISTGLNLTLATWYRIEGTMVATTSTNVALTVNVYANTGTTILGNASVGGNCAIQAIDKVNWGVRQVFGNTNAAQDHDFDDLRIDDQRNGQIGPGAMLTAVYVNGDSAVQWTSSSGGANYTNIDDWVTDADYNTTPAGGTDQEDILDLAATTSGNTVTGVLCLHRQADVVGVVGANLRFGLTMGGTRYEAPSHLSDNGTGAKIYRGEVIDFSGNGLDNTDYDAAQVHYRRSGGGGFQIDLFSHIVLQEDDDAGAPPAAPTNQHQRGMVI